MTTQSRPIARSIFLCDRFMRQESGKCDVRGIFTRVAADEWPHVHILITVFCELTDGLGIIPFRLDVVRASDGRPIHETPTRQMRFVDRMDVVQLVYHLRHVRFPDPGIYFIELWIDDECLADARLVVE